MKVRVYEIPEIHYYIEIQIPPEWKWSGRGNARFTVSLDNPLKIDKYGNEVVLMKANTNDWPGTETDMTLELQDESIFRMLRENEYFFNTDL